MLAGMGCRRALHAKKMTHLFLLQACLSFVASCAVASTEGLESGFESPPDAAKVYTWWHWMNGNVTREGIRADLEAMKDVGLGGFQLFDVLGAPEGAVKYGSREWRDMVLYALEVADELGLDAGMHNCAGWSSSGGPWVSIEQSMQELVFSEITIQGAGEVDVLLPVPLTRLGYYRDVAVLAFPSVASGDGTAQETPFLSSNIEGFEVAALTDALDDTVVEMLPPAEGNPHYIQYEYARPYRACRLYIDPDPARLGFSGYLSASDDGIHFEKITEFSFDYGSHAKTFSFPEVSARFYRLVVTQAAGSLSSSRSTMTIKAMVLDDDFRLMNYEQKAGFQRAAYPGIDTQADRVPGRFSIPLESVVDLTDRVDTDGCLSWDAPPGEWTILRVGHTAMGEVNMPASVGGRGLECDKLSRAAVVAFWDGMMAKVVADAGPLAGTTLTNILVDSYEKRSTNWTVELPEEFRARCGYSLRKFLPAMTGRIVEDGILTERFLWDFRRVLADMFEENYSTVLAELAAAHGIELALEPGGSSPADDLLYSRPAAIPMMEFWVGGDPLWRTRTTPLAASAAHIYDKTYVGGEAFTGRPSVERWTNDPHSLKALGDAVYCSGVNRFYMHTFAHQPWLDRAPGMTMGRWGTHFDRMNTWWSQASDWVEYMGRAQYLLQSGKFVADVLYFYGEGAPVGDRALVPPVPAGYRYDRCNADVILNRMQVRDGRLVLDGGQSYRLLVLPPERQMTPEMLRKIRELVMAGATVMGPRPEISPSLKDYPECDREVAVLAGEIWGNCDGQVVKEHTLGRGRVLWGNSVSDVLVEMGVEPDFMMTPEPAPVGFIHRKTDQADIYFVANVMDSPQRVECSFRVHGKVPELWQPDTGGRRPAAVYRDEGSRTVVPLELGPSESLFVIFRRDQVGGNHLVRAYASAPEVEGVGIVNAVYEGIQDPSRCVVVTARVDRLLKDNDGSVSVSNRSLGGDPAPGMKKQLRVRYRTDGLEKEATISEGLELSLADLSGGGTSPSFRVEGLDAGRVELTASGAGTFYLESAGGELCEVVIDRLPPPLEILGGWTVEFPEGKGAPDSIVLDRLMSWTDYPESGVRYFSGTATYRKTFELPADMTGDGLELDLDLGEVKNIARVWLNGVDLGLLWKAPFRLDASGVLRSGRNDLVIEVTNLWPNRLIGDEQLPSDCNWKKGRGASEGSYLTQWPQWLLYDMSSPSGRVTFSSWKHWNKDDGLLPSGLLGPVKVLPQARRIVVLGEFSPSR